MTDANYSPPQARVTDPDQSSQHQFYVVSQRKFLLLYFGTAGLYSMYWFYRHWKQQRIARGWDVWPVWRSIFSIFFTHSLFAEIDQRLRQRGHVRKWYPTAMATAYVAMRIADNVISRIPVSSLLLDVIGVLLMPLLVIPLRSAQLAANLADEDRYGESNDTLTAANFAWMALGGLIWLTVAFGFYASWFAPELLR